MEHLTTVIYYFRRFQDKYYYTKIEVRTRYKLAKSWMIPSGILYSVNVRQWELGTRNIGN